MAIRFLVWLLSAALICTSILPRTSATKASLWTYPPEWKHYFFTCYTPNTSYDVACLEQTMARSGYAGTCVENQTAAGAKSQMPALSVFSFAGHANRHILQFCSGYIFSYYDLMGSTQVNDLEDNKLFVFVGCKTARDCWDDPAYPGLMLAAAFDRHGDCAVGFENDVSFPSGCYWLNRFFIYMVDYSLTASIAAQYATEDTGNYWFGYGGTNYYKILGDKRLKIRPRDYGTEDNSLLSNANFESNLTGWTPLSGGWTIDSTAGIYRYNDPANPRCPLVPSKAAGVDYSTYSVQLRSNSVYVSTNLKYHAEAVVRDAGSHTTARVRLAVQWLGSGGSIISTSYSPWVDNYQHDWERLAARQLNPPSGAVQARVILEGEGKSLPDNGGWLWDNVNFGIEGYSC